jgi:hypothetical protein
VKDTKEEEEEKEDTVVSPPIPPKVFAFTNHFVEKLWIPEFYIQ